MVRGFARLAQRFDLRTAIAAYNARLVSSVVPAARWQVKAMPLRGVAHPVFLRPGTTDWRVLHQIFVDQEYDSASPEHDAALARFYDDAIRRQEVPVIVDCGANIGLASIWYAQRYPRARIIAVEPEPENFRVLAMNAANYPNITPVQGGISDRQTRVSLANVGDAPWAWETKESADTGEIATFTVPGLVADVPASRLMIVKIDIEGFEVELFRSNLHWCRDTPLIVFESHDRLFVWRGTFHAIILALAARPRDYIQKGENTFAFSHDLKSEPGPQDKALKPPCAEQASGR
jgi:FkbM family methyltransferase